MRNMPVRKRAIILVILLLLLWLCGLGAFSAFGIPKGEASVKIKDEDNTRIQELSEPVKLEDPVELKQQKLILQTNYAWRLYTSEKFKVKFLVPSEFYVGENTGFILVNYFNQETQRYDYGHMNISNRVSGICDPRFADPIPEGDANYIPIPSFTFKGQEIKFTQYQNNIGNLQLSPAGEACTDSNLLTSFLRVSCSQVESDLFVYINQTTSPECVEGVVVHQTTTPERLQIYTQILSTMERI